MISSPARPRARRHGGGAACRLPSHTFGAAKAIDYKGSGGWQWRDKFPKVNAVSPEAARRAPAP